VGEREVRKRRMRGEGGIERKGGEQHMHTRAHTYIHTYIHTLMFGRKENIIVGFIAGQVAAAVIHHKHKHGHVAIIYVIMKMVVDGRVGR
jgi:hypothetical protein